MDYQAYAYLQTGAGRRGATAGRRRCRRSRARFDPDAIGVGRAGLAGVFALAAIPARYALERGDWAAAAQLDAATEPLSLHRRADLFRARRSARARPATPRRRGPRSTRSKTIAAPADGQRRSPTGPGRPRSSAARRRPGWRSPKGGRAEALAEMRAAATLEDATEKSAVTPGPLAPARELLGEMLLQMGQPARGAARNSRRR